MKVTLKDRLPHYNIKKNTPNTLTPLFFNIIYIITLIIRAHDKIIFIFIIYNYARVIDIISKCANNNGKLIKIDSV